jgi:membrane fusion protein (multidrug efflux system)
MNLFLALSLTLVLNLGCEKSSDQKSKETKSTADQQPKESDKKQSKKRRGGASGLIPVRTILTKTENLPETIEVISVLSGRKQADVYSRVAGKISFLGSEEGQPIKEGQILFRVDRSDPGESFLATPVASPISGWVGRWWVTSLGSQVSAQQPVVTVVDDEVLIGRIRLPTDQWLKVSESTPIRVKVGSEIREGKVIGITRSAETSSSRGTISVEIQNTNHQWKSGMISTVALDLDTKPRLIVPATALSITDQGGFVFAVNDSVSKRMPVKFEAIDNDRVEITEGLTSGIQIVTQGVNQVSDGLTVKVVENAKDTSP